MQVYRAQLAANPNDAATQIALERLQERSLSDIQSLITEGYVSTASRSLEIVSRLFPELVENVRYKYLVARTDYMRRDVKDELAKTEQVIASATPAVTQKADSSMSASPAVPTKNADSNATSTSVSATSASIAKKPVENSASLEPEIRSVSIMPGRLVDNRFVPADGGNAFQVEISYRNFDRAFIGEAQATLITLLGIPDEPLVLAEVPTVITADRGTKTFVMETNSVQGYAGGKFQLNFMVNDELLTSRTLRLSRPAR